MILVDSVGDFYPPALASYGIGLDRVVVIRPRNEKDAFWAVDQSLRCPAAGMVFASLGTLNDRLARRLQLAAESTGGFAVILRPVRQPTHRFAAVQMRVESVPPLSAEDCLIRRCRLTLLTVREGSPVEPFLVDLDDETDAGSLSAVPVDRPAARTG